MSIMNRHCRPNRLGFFQKRNSIFKTDCCGFVGVAPKRRLRQSLRCVENCDSSQNPTPATKTGNICSTTRSLTVEEMETMPYAQTKRKRGGHCFFYAGI